MLKKGGEQMKSDKPINKKAVKVTFYTSLVAVVLIIAYIIWYFCSIYLFVEDHNEVGSKFASIINSSSGSEVVLAENPVNFKEEIKKYPDLYAWLFIPDNTQKDENGDATLLVNQPIVQSMENDAFYLDHGPDKSSSKSGAIYSEMKNSTDFSDPNTILYGHNMRGYKMFGALHKFRTVGGFFEANRYIYIFLPGRKLTYEIFAAYRADNTHLLNAYNFSDPKVFAEYIEKVKNPKSVYLKKREVKLDTNSKLLTLSTCIGNSAYRYLVQGVLIKDEPTK